MKPLALTPNLVEQVLDAILAEISSGQLAPGDRIIQEQIAKTLGVSRQPVQQALLLLRNQQVLREAPGRGLEVAPLDPDHVQHMYDIRAVMEGLACRLAAEHGAERAARQGPAIIEAGRKAVASAPQGSAGAPQASLTSSGGGAGSAQPWGRYVARLVAADMRFHEFLYSLSGNPLIAPSMSNHWTHTQRVMGEVLTRDEAPRDIWDQHAAILQAIAEGNAPLAETLARSHITQAAGFMVARMRGDDRGHLTA